MVPEDTAISLERSECFGSCPSYKVTVFADGLLVFEGRNYVKELRTFKTVVSREQISRLLREMDGLFSPGLRDEYVEGPAECGNEWTDSFTDIISIQANGKRKSVKHYNGCQGTPITAELTALATTIEEVLGTPKWIGTI